MAISRTRHNPFAHAWYVEINDETYEVINKWWKTQTNTSLYDDGFCGFYLDESSRLFLGHIRKGDPIKNEHNNYDFGIELSFNDFVKYVLNEKPCLSKSLNINKLLTILNYINNYEK